jgi:hypothetical protein
MEIITNVSYNIVVEMECNEIDVLEGTNETLIISQSLKEKIFDEADNILQTSTIKPILTEFEII